MKLVKYDAACRALAAAKNAREVLKIKVEAQALQAAARIAKNKQLEADAYEIRELAERRLGEMMAAQEKAKGAREPGTKRGTTRVIEKPASLAAAGIDKNLAHRARSKAAMPKAKFEAMVAAGREETMKAAERRELSRASRQERHRVIAMKAERATVLDNPGPFPLIYADPPWKWGHFGSIDYENEAGKGRTPDQHYQTMSYDEIMEFSIRGKTIKEIAHKDAALFLWCTSANIEMALEVMKAWGFTYKAHAVWDKGIAGLGLVFRNRHEPLLYGTRGNMPGPQYQPPSVFNFKRGRHSEKPREIRSIIEKMYPVFDASSRLELFARERVKGWTSFGFEAVDKAA